MSHHYRYETLPYQRTTIGTCDCGLVTVSHSTIAAKRLLDRKHHRQRLSAFEKMTARELRQYARDHGMSSITRLTKKDELIKAIVRYLTTKGQQ